MQIFYGSLLWHEVGADPYHKKMKRKLEIIQSGILDKEFRFTELPVGSTCIKIGGRDH